jgi:cell division protein FtsA
MGAQDTLHHEPRSLLTGIIRSRVEETFEILRDRMQKRGLDEYAGRRIVLTGGGSRLNGVREVAECVFNKRVRLGQPHGIRGFDDMLSGPDFAVAAGLLKYRYHDSVEAVQGMPDLSGRRYRQKRYGGGGVGRTLRWLRDNF